MVHDTIEMYVSVHENYHHLISYCVLHRLYVAVNSTIIFLHRLYAIKDPFNEYYQFN